MPFRTLAIVLAPAVALSLGGCSTLSQVFNQVRGGPPAAKLEIRSAKLADQPAAALQPAVQDRLYLKAREAISRRDYAAALDLLQLARERAPEDSRLLNALAVTYDKLGRFDLSARYYALALKAEPDSAVVLANLRYSEQLKGRAQAAQAERQLAAKPQAAPAGDLALARSSVTPSKVQPLLVGAPLLVLNASGRPAGHEPVRSFLADAGWSVKSRLEARPVRSVSEVRFAEAHRPIAEALARTLPFEIALRPCVQACSELELWVGENARLKEQSS